jgi:exodeoxyribonuclease V alpha subunit
MTDIASLLRTDYLSFLDVHFATTVSRIAGEPRSEVLLAAALVSRAVRQGHVCLDLEALCREPLLRDAEGETLAEQPWPLLPDWLEALRASPLLGTAGEDGPLVLAEGGLLYLRRYWQHERLLAERLLARAAVIDADVDADWMRAALDRLFRDNPSPAQGIDWQRMAALFGAVRRLCVISGGPGTGKTYTVVKILALLVELAQQRGEPVPRILLMAPTGKAAARLRESIRKAKAGLDTADAVKAAIPDAAATIHRCLQSIGGSATRFRHHAGNPLPAEIVLVDEASMVDIGLMARLVAAVPESARLILLGDKDQLASVEAGAVLGDICNTGAATAYSHAMAGVVHALSRDSLPLTPAAPQTTGIWDCVVQLTRSYRYSETSGIGALARAINAGDADTALQWLDGDDVSVQRVDPASGWEMSSALRDSVCAGFRPYLEAPEPAQQLALLERFRVLCAHRRGIGGVETLNLQAEKVLREAGLLSGGGEMYPGRPLMVTQNDYPLQLFNGDVGLVVCETGTDHLLVLFAGEQGALRRLSAARLPPHETVFAMSVHKSQGSELDEVAVVLPQKPSPVLSRELLYTAVTRARQRVSVHATAEILRHTIRRRIERTSGLRQRLWGSMGA